MTELQRCGWARGAQNMVCYHDEEWGRPCHDDRVLFEFLLLEGFQAGLSWACILNKRENFRRALDGFDPEKIAEYGEEKIEELLCDAGIVRSRSKLTAAVGNAKAFRAIQQEFGSFDAYLWGFTGGQVVRERALPVPASTELSDRVSRDLKKRGMKYVGTVIVYAYLQAVGVVDAHEPGCYLYTE